MGCLYSKTTIKPLANVKTTLQQQATVKVRGVPDGDSPHTTAVVKTTDRQSARVSIIHQPFAIVSIGMTPASVKIKHVCSASVEELLVLAGTDGVFVDKFGEYFLLDPSKEG